MWLCSHPFSVLSPVLLSEAENRMWQGSGVNSVISSRLKSVLSETTPLPFSADPSPYSTPHLAPGAGMELVRWHEPLTQYGLFFLLWRRRLILIANWKRSRREIRWWPYLVFLQRVLTAAFWRKCESKHSQGFEQTRWQLLRFFYKWGAMLLWYAVDLMRLCIIYYGAHPL